MRDKANIESMYYLSPLQEGLLFHRIADADGDPYFFQYAYTLQGEIRLDAFAQAWQQVVDRHGILRTAFVWEGVERPVQIVHRQAAIPIGRHDWRGTSAQEQRRNLESFLREDRAKGFDFFLPPLMRLHMIRVAECEWIFINTHHHILLDGWSMALLLRDVLAAYAAIVDGQPVVLSAPRPYRDYIAWVNRQDLQAAESFWRHALKGFDSPTTLAIAPPQRAISSEMLPYAEQTVSISAEQTTTLQAFARRCHITLNTLIQGAWALLLQRYSGDSEVLFGATVSGRPSGLDGATDMLGLFINTVPIRVAVQADMTLSTWLRGLQEQNSLIRQYEWTPLSSVQRWSDIQGGRSLFDSLLVFESYPDVDQNALHPTMTVTPLARRDDGPHTLTTGRNNYPLSLMVEPGAEIHLIACYAHRQFSHDAISALLRHVIAILDSMGAGAAKRVGEISLLTAEEGRQLAEWHDAVPALAASDACIHSLIETQVQTRPDTVAIVTETDRLSYGELDRRANRLAHYLRGLGVGSEARVAVSLERSVDLIVAILGILKAGGAYVPLDPGFPKERLTYMTADSGAQVLVSHSKTSQGLSGIDARLVLLDREADHIDRCPDVPPSSLVTAQNLAYIIYTSGTTGRPKGVTVEHRHVVQYVRSLLDRLALPAEWSMAALSTVAADLGNTALFGALCSGRPLHILSTDQGFDPDSMATYMREHGVDVLKIVPSHLKGLLNAERPEWVLPKHCLILGGEAVLPELVDRVRSLAPDCRIVNHYGPTETTVGVLTHQVEPISGEAEGVPIGRPLASTQAYVLDPTGQPAPIGMTGELYIGGRTVTRGYLHRPDLTAERFLPDAFGEQPGGRLYRTGDRVRLRPDKTIEFLGRVDSQIKLRGFRIELGEIDAHLRQVPGITAAVTLVRETTDGTRQLVAYVVGTAEIDTASVRAALSRQLPDYMIPQTVVLLESFPLTANGKLDRNAFPDPGQPQSGCADSYVAPRNHVEETLAAIWAEVLRLERVGITDNFFDLGGDSILCLQLVGKAQRSGVKLTPKLVFQHHTIDAIAATFDEPFIPLREQEAERPVPASAPFSLARLDPGSLQSLLARYEQGVEDLYPASPMQQGMLFHSLRAEQAGAYHNQVVYVFKAGFDAEAFERAWQQTVQRHAILRTAFVWDVAADPLQVVLRDVRIPVEHLDWRDLDGEAGQQTALQQFLAHDRARGFNFDRPPLMRLAVMRLTEQSWQVIWSLHHAILDGSCQGLLVKEVLTRYQLIRQGEDRSEKPAASYREYMRWLSQQDSAGAEEFWRTYLKGFQSPTRLPERSHSLTRDSEYGERRIELSTDTTLVLQRLAQSQRVTLNTVIQAVWGLLLARYSGEDDVLFGVTVSGRPADLPDGDSILGLFINTLPLRLRIDPSGTLSNWLRDIQALNVELRRHEYTPLIQAQGWSEIARGTSLFDSLLVFQNYAMDESIETDAQALNIETINVEGWTNYPLTITVVPEKRLTLIFSYDKQRVDDDMVCRMADHWRILIDNMIATPEARLSALPVLPEAERQRFLGAWNATGRSYSSDSCLHHLFEAQAKRTPDAVAVLFEETQLSYRELNRRANQVAHVLKQHGVGPEVLVGMCLERSQDMLVALLGILKAGGAYVPLDPTYPRERLAYMLEDAGMPVVLTQQKLRETVSAPGVQPICLDDRGRFESESTENPVVAQSSDALAYVIYTSGSTGRPKGVMIRHRSVVNFLLSMIEELQLAAADVVVATTSISFDIAVLELFLPLLAGARTVVVSRETLIDGRRLEAELRRVGATLMQATPSGWRLLLAAGDVPALRVLCGGEAFPQELAHEFLERRLEPWNLYGPTETTVWSMTSRVTSTDGPISLGGPIANTQVYLLDTDFNLVPMGVPGEVYIGGDGLARGYCRRPELTADRFIPDPFSSQAGSRLYRTGDQARHRPDGSVEFLGRLDHQVKLRGYRIELGEIEACLNRHPQIMQSIVTAREDDGDKRLVAYVRGEQLTHSSLENVRQFLHAELPDYMLPSVFIPLYAFPLTPNGKIDRKALPEPEDNRSTDQHVPPRQATEEILAGIWADTLGVTAIGIRDNFFELGGHSLLATQVMSRVRAAFQIELPLRSLFDSPTVEDLAAAIDGTYADRSATQAPPLVPVPREGRLPLSFAQQRLWFLTQMDQEQGSYNLPFALRLAGSLSHEALERSFTELVRRHETLRTTFPSVEGEPMQVIAAAGHVSVPVEDLTGLPDEERAGAIKRFAHEEASRPFYLDRDPPMRTRMLRLKPDEHVLLVTVHHIAADAWSLALVTKEVAAFYGAIVAPADPTSDAAQISLQEILPELPVQYADFSSWQRQWLQGELLEKEVGYWKQRLGSNPPQLALPADHPRPDVHTYRGGRLPFHVPHEVAETLRLLSRRHGTTLFMTLLAAFNVLLSRWTGQTDLLVGTDVANRNRGETEHVIGFFVNLLPLRTDLSGNPTFIELLGRVRETALGAYAHQDVPFEKIVESLKLTRDLSRNPLVQALFVLQNVPPPFLQLPGLDVEALEFDHEVSRFDLGLFMEETEEGVTGVWKFSRDLFEPDTIAKMAQQFVTLLSQVATSSERQIEKLDLLNDAEKERQMIESKQREAGKLQKFKSIKPKAVKLSQRILVTRDPLSPDLSLPWLMRPAVEDVDLAGWAKENRLLIQDDLIKHGALLFRGFSIRTVAEFEAVAQAVCPDLFGEYGDLPREKSGRHVYGSTPYPADKAILFHNESSHMHRWPLKQFFFCVQAAPEGGETPIVDCRTLYQQLTAETRDRFQDKQLMYVRNFTPGVDVSWQDFFRTTDRAVVEELCAQHGMEYEWMENDSLRTRQVCPAVIEHPKTGEWVFFNQIELHHVSCLEPAVRESLLSMLGLEWMPRNVYYGDGSPIEEEVVAEISALYQRTAVRFRWQEGDLLMLDNMLVAHARDPFVGPRKIVVAMGEMIHQAATYSFNP